MDIPHDSTERMAETEQNRQATKRASRTYVSVLAVGGGVARGRTEMGRIHNRDNEGNAHSLWGKATPEL